MRTMRLRKVVVGIVTGVMLFQATPGGMLCAYAAENGITVDLAKDDLAAKLAARAGDYPAGAFAFYPEASVELAEGDADREVKVVRWGDASQAATVDIKAFSLTAEYGADYEVYVKDGLSNKGLEEVDPQDSKVSAKGALEAEAAEKEAAEAVAAATADPEEGDDPARDSLRDAYAIQTGTDTARTNWRGEYEEALAPVAAVEAANNIANAVPGPQATLAFAEGEYEKSVFISVKDDTLSEGKEAFRLVLGNASAGVLGEQMQLVASIEDNEEGEPIVFGMRDAEVTVAAGAEYAEVTVDRTSGTEYFAGVVASTAAGTATSEESYEPLDGATLAFAAGVTEQVVRIPLRDGAIAGTQFTVKLDTEANNIEDGREQTVVKIEAAGEPAQEASTADITTESDLTAAAPLEQRSESVKGDAPRLLSTGRMTHDGVVYDEQTWKLGPSWRNDVSGPDSSAWVWGNFSSAREATRARTVCEVSGYTSHWIFGKPDYKNMRVDFGGSTVVRRESNNKRSTYTDWFDIDWGQSQNNELKFFVNTDRTCYDAEIAGKELSLYYPRYTLTLSDADANVKLTGKSYSSSNKYTEFKVNSLASGKASWNTRTVSRGYRMGINPGALTNGVGVDKFELYVGNTKVKEIKGSSLSYSDLNGIRAQHDKLLRENKYKVRVKPVYKVHSATVKFASQDASAIAFSGDRAGGNGFKVGDTLKCSMIDKVSFTAMCPTNQKIKVKSVAHNTGWQKLDVWTPRDEADALKFERTFEVNYPSENVTVGYNDMSLTYEYTPEEADAVNSGVGSVLVYDSRDLNTVLGATTVESPLKLTGNVDMLRNTYVARVLGGDGFQSGTVVNGIPYSTRTVWTYKDPVTGAAKSTMGSSLMFNPHYADETVNYHFKSVQDDRVPVGVTGTVYIMEKPLFTQNASQKSKPAVGVSLDVGGENAISDRDGKYTIQPKFNKGEYVSAFLKYDSLMAMGNVALSKNTVKDFYLSVDETDPLKVTSSTLYKLTDTGEKDMGNKTIFDKRESASILLEDTEYTFNLTASGSAGIVPARAEFYFYDAKGNRKTDKTQQAAFVDGTAELKLNPSAADLKVGDTITVKLFDTKGQGYFEHQTSLIVGKKATGSYTFNYAGTKREDDNLFLKALGNISIGYDFVLEILGGNSGTYEAADGSKHQLCYIGLGDGFQNQGTNAEREVYNTLQETIADIHNVNTGQFRLNRQDSMQFFGNGNWAFRFNLGIIYDMVQQDKGDRKGEYLFSDYVVLANASAAYQKEWEVPVGPATLTFGLSFNLGNEADDVDGVSVKWHFFNEEGKDYYVEENAALDLLAAKGIENEGYIGFAARVVGSLKAEFLGGLIGGAGELAVTVGDRVGSTKGTWSNYGEVLLVPAVKLVVLSMPIPIWTQTWRHSWSDDDISSRSEASARMMSVINENMSAGNILFTPTAGIEPQDYSYTEDRSAWNGDGEDAPSLFSLFSAKEDKGDHGVVQDDFLSDTDISLYNLGDGKYLATFLDAVPGRADINKIGAYYSVYDGASWSAPKLFKDDGTEDQLPVIMDAGSKGVLIAWSSASRKFEDGEPLVDRLNTLDIQGCFYKDGRLGDVMNITSTTPQDAYADTNPQLAYYKGKDGVEHLKVYYTKSEFTVSSREEGEVVGDLLNPDMLNLTRDYDFAANEWKGTYSGRTKEQIIESLKAKYGDAYTDAVYQQYEKDMYGQVFLELAPAVDITEQLDGNGFWIEGTGATVTELDQGEASIRMVKDSDSIAYNDLGLLAYSLDKGGMAQTTGDQNLYLQVYNMNDDEFHHPIMLSAKDAEISDIQFVRSSYEDATGGKHEITWLYWKEQTSETVKDEAGNDQVQAVSQIKRLDISTLVSNEKNLIKGVTASGQPYYYINKSAGDAGTTYAPAQVLASSTPDADEGTDFTTIGTVQVKSSEDGRYSYIAWTQPVKVGGEDDSKHERQLFVMREDTKTGEMSRPVQVTKAADQYLTAFDFGVTSAGNIDVLAASQQVTLQEVLDEAGGKTGASIYQPDIESTKLVFTSIVPSDDVKVDDVTVGGLTTDEDGVLVSLETAVHNESFTSLKDVVVEAVDAKGNVVYSSANEAAQGYARVETVQAEDGGVVFEGGSATSVSLGAVLIDGGSVLELPMRIPVDAAGTYDVTLKVTSGDSVVATKKVKGSVPIMLGASGLEAKVVKRDQVELSATLLNENLLSTDERVVGYGYIDANGERVEIGTKKLKAIEPGQSVQFSQKIDVDFSEFESKKGEDGSLVDARTFYLDLDPKGSTAATADEGVALEGENTATMLRATLELRATADQVSIMEAAKNLSAVYVVDDGEGGMAKKDGIKAGERARLGLTVDGKLAQSEDEFVNGIKVVWDESGSDVVEVEPDGSIKALKPGKATLTAKVMPANTASELFAGGMSEEIDNYDSMPSSLVKTIKVTVTVDEGTPSGPGEGPGGDVPGSGSTDVPGSGTVDGNPSQGGTSGNLPTTGDQTSIIALAGIAVAGALLVAAGAMMKRNKKERRK